MHSDKNKEKMPATLIACKNSGCRETFPNRMARKRHVDKKKCKGSVPKVSKLIAGGAKNSDNTYMCMKCNRSISMAGYSFVVPLHPLQTYL